MFNPIEKTDGGFITLHQIANIEFQSQEMGSQVTIIEWLKELLCRVWVEQEDFSGKRAFGNSDWMWDIYECLYDNNIISGEMSDFDELELSKEEFEKVDKIILDIIVEVL